MSERPAARRFILGTAAALIILAAFECLLRLAGFRYERSVSYMEFNFPRPHELHQIFEPDPDLLWKMRPNYDFGEGFEPLNRFGFRGPWVSPAKKNGTLRVACLGDSVTFGRPEAGYPRIMAGLLEDRLDKPVEVMNLGVPGYSSWQGKRLIRKILDQYHPDVVVVLFGWNDHWLAKGFPDSDQVLGKKPDIAPPNPLARLRIYQLLNKIAAAATVRLEKPPSVLRVAPPDYRANLAEIIEATQRAKARPVLATAPSAIPTGEVPDFLTHLGFIREPQELKALHDEYNDIVREIARERSIELVDLDLIFKGRDVASLYDSPGDDVIHPNAEGYRLMAESLAESIATVVPQ